MKRKMLAAVALFALLSPVHPASSTEVVADSVVTESAAAKNSVSDRDLWKDASATPGESIVIPFEGNVDFTNLEVAAADQFQDFRTLVDLNQNIVVFVPKDLPGAVKASPVFTVRDDSGEIDTFAIDVAYPNPTSPADKNMSLLVKIISDIAIRMPQLPFVANLFRI